MKQPESQTERAQKVAKRLRDEADFLEVSESFVPQDEIEYLRAAADMLEELAAEIDTARKKLNDG